jgi:Flp pilus assembly protein TadG
MIFQNRRSTGMRRRFMRNQEGAAAVEFAMVAPIFLALMFSIMELGWVFFLDNLAEVSAGDASRLIRTGQIQKISTDDDPDAQRKAVFDEVCKTAKVLGACDEIITVEVTTYDDFSALASDNSDVVCNNSSKDERDNLQFNPGGDDSIVRVRICILYESFNPGVGMSLKQTQGQPNRIIMQELFRNEPFSRNGSTSS